VNKTLKKIAGFGGVLALTLALSGCFPKTLNPFAQAKSSVDILTDAYNTVAYRCGNNPQDFAVYTKKQCTFMATKLDEIADTLVPAAKAITIPGAIDTTTKVTTANDLLLQILLIYKDMEDNTAFLEAPFELAGFREHVKNTKGGRYRPHEKAKQRRSQQRYHDCRSHQRRA
jgi:hypothetical protein